MKGTNKMGAVKQSVIDTIHEDQTDPRDMGNYPGEPDNANDLEELAVGFVMVELSNAISTIEQNPEKFRSEYDEIDTLTSRLQEITAKLDKPF